MSDDRYEELTQRVAGDAATADALRQLWPLSNFATYSILQSQYTFPEEFDSAIALSSEGEIMRDRVMSAHASLKSADVKVAIFGHFYGKDLYLDLEKTDRDQILRVLSAEVAACRIRYPFVHWRQLYDKYYDAYRSNSISPSVDGTPEFAPRYSSRSVPSRQHSVRTVRAHRVKSLTINLAHDGCAIGPL